MSDEAMFNAHCLALGRLCVAWAFVDRQLNDLLAALVRCSPVAAACIATAADSIAARCNIMRPLAFENPISSDWAQAFGELLGRLEELGRQRNRMVHDRWELTKGSLRRVDRRASARKAQSRKPKAVVFDTAHVTQPDEVDRLTEEVGRTAFLLHCAQRDLEDWLQEGLRVAPPLLIRAGDLQSVPDVIQLIGAGASRPPRPSPR